MRRTAWALVVVLGAVGCGGPPAPKGAPPLDEAAVRAQVSAFAAAERRALEQLAAGDPRVALRAELTPPESVSKKLGSQAILAEDTSAIVVGASLDLFSFQGRARALAAAEAELASAKGPWPEQAPPGSAVLRPRLERELFVRFIAEERARLAREQRLGDASADLIRGVLATWTPPADAARRDDEIARRLQLVRASVASAEPAEAPSDLDSALDPLERLLNPAVYPRSMAALAELRLALSNDARPAPRSTLPDRLRAEMRDHLGVSPEVASLRATLERAEEKLRALATRAGADKDEDPAPVEPLLFASGRCGHRALASPVRSMRPPPEREAICGALRSILVGKAQPRAMLVALHDAVVVAIWALPPLLQSARHARPLAAWGEDALDRFHRLAGSRPLLPLGVALMADLLLRGDLAARAEKWLAFGDAPLDVIEREVFVER